MPHFECGAFNHSATSPETRRFGEQRSPVVRRRNNTVLRAGARAWGGDIWEKIGAGCLPLARDGAARLTSQPICGYQTKRSVVAFRRAFCFGLGQNGREAGFPGASPLQAIHPKPIPCWFSCKEAGRAGPVPEKPQAFRIGNRTRSAEPDMNTRKNDVRSH
jgi:hypothetical protein